jgi:hypothetical protein
MSCHERCSHGTRHENRGEAVSCLYCPQRLEHCVLWMFCVSAFWNLMYARNVYVRMDLGVGKRQKVRGNIQCFIYGLYVCVHACSDLRMYWILYRYSVGFEAFMAVTMKSTVTCPSKRRLPLNDMLLRSRRHCPCAPPWKPLIRHSLLYVRYRKFCFTWSLRKWDVFIIGVM